MSSRFFQTVPMKPEEETRARTCVTHRKRSRSHHFLPPGGEDLRVTQKSRSTGVSQLLQGYGALLVLAHVRVWTGSGRPCEQSQNPHLDPCVSAGPQVTHTVSMTQSHLRGNVEPVFG